MSLHITGGRAVVLDTETTGLYPNRGDRLVEIGMVELIDRKITGRTLQRYVNPRCVIPQEAINVHGLTNDFLKRQPLFAEVVEDIVEFVDGAEIVIHSAPFDLGFLNMEFARVGMGSFDSYAMSITDSLQMSRELGKTKKHSLDFLCDFYKVDRSQRQFHGALLDANLLAEVYLRMTAVQDSLVQANTAVVPRRNLPESVVGATVHQVVVSESQRQDHDAYMVALEKANGKQPLWLT